MNNEELIEEKLEQEFNQDILEENIEEVLAENKYILALPRDSQGYEHTDETEAGSLRGASRIFKARLPDTYQSSYEAEDLLEYIGEE